MKSAISRSRTDSSPTRLLPVASPRPLVPWGLVSEQDLTTRIVPIKQSALYCVGDLAAGFAIGATVVFIHYLLILPNLPLVASAVIGMLSGMAAQMLLSILLGGFLGSMEMMIPGMFVGMFGMLPSLLPIHNPRMEILLGGALGLLVFLVFGVWDKKLKGRPPIMPPPTDPSFVSQNPPMKSRDQTPGANHGGGPGSVPRWNAAWLYDALEQAGVQRRGPFQRRLFDKMEGKILFGAAGTGLNFSNFPSWKEIIAVDCSEQMLARARPKAVRYEGTLSLQLADLERLEFTDETFDTVATASTLCSVRAPLQVLQELRRVLKPGGRLLLFEHVRSRNFLLGPMLDFLNFILKFLGSAMNRDTLKSVLRAGFVIDHVECVYLDIFVAIEGHKPDATL